MSFELKMSVWADKCAARAALWESGLLRWPCFCNLLLSEAGCPRGLCERFTFFYKILYPLVRDLGTLKSDYLLSLQR